MALKQELYHLGSTIPRSVADHPVSWVLVLAILISACGQASPQGLDELGAKPGVGILTIYPQNPEIESGEKVQFVLKDGSGRLADGPVSWSATGGTITRDGLYTAGAIAGTYSIKAKTRGGSVTQKVKVVTNSTSQPPDSTDPSSSDEDPANDPGTPDDPDTQTILFADDFERGDFRVWSGAALVGDPRWNGSGDGGAHIGDGFITSELVRSGQLAWKAMVDPTQESYSKANKSSLERWKGMGASEFYISAWYFVPSDYPTIDAQLMQMKSAGSGPSHKPVGFRMSRRDRELYVRSEILNATLYRTGVKVPSDRWFNLTGRFVIADSGLVEMWLDGQKIASIRTDTKDNDHAYPGVGNYVSSSDYPVTCHIYIDDVKVTY